MSDIREIKRRIKSVTSIAQVTRAMQTVAASNMRRAQAQALAARPYSDKAFEVLLYLAEQGAGEVRAQNRSLLRQFCVRTTYLILITSDKGLCGPYNINILRAALDFIKVSPHPVKVIAVGRKGRDFMIHNGFDVVAEFSNLPPHPRLLDVSPIARLAIDQYEGKCCDDVYIAYTKFVNTLKQLPRIWRLLPITTSPEMVEEQMRKYVLTSTFEAVESADVVCSECDFEHSGHGYIYEPDPVTVLDTVLPRFTELMVYQSMLEALASEHSARLVAMRAASDNARELLSDLQLAYYRARQTAITAEILDIVGGAEAAAKG